MTCAHETCTNDKAPGRSLCYAHYGRERRARTGLPGTEVQRTLADLGMDDVGDVRAVWVKTSGEKVSGLSVLLSPPKEEAASVYAALAPADPVRVVVRPIRPRPTHTDTRLLFLTDTQTGYRRTGAGELEPFHDEEALSACLSLAAEVQPDIIVHGGDDLDFPVLSRFAAESGFLDTLRPALNRRHRHLAELRALVPNHVAYQLEGNHEARLPRTLAKQVPELADLRPAGGDGQDWPLLSVPRLLRLDEVGVQYVSGYPAAELVISPKLRCIHGQQVKSDGSTAALVVRSALTNTLYGHTHRMEYASVRDREGTPRWAASPGTLARVDGAVPSFHGAVSGKTGESIRRHESWTQGAAVVSWTGDEDPSIELVSIEGGRCVYRGERYGFPAAAAAA